MTQVDDRDRPGEHITAETLRAAEHRLVERMLVGDETAFESFFESCFPPLYRFALRRVRGDESVAEEVTQKTLCTAIDTIAGWRGEAALLTWLCAICRHKIVDHYRRLRRPGVQVELSEDLPEVRAALESMLSGEPDPETHTLRREMAELVHVALDRLPQHYARVLEWKYLEDRSMKEIALGMGCSVKAVESLLTRARVSYRDVIGALASSSGAVRTRGEAHG